MNSDRFHSNEGRLEQGLGASESLVANSDDLTIGQFVAFLQRGAASSGLHFLFEVEGDVTQLLLDVTDNLTFGGSGEGVSTFSQDLHQVVSQVTAGQIHTQDSVGKCISF